MRIQRHVCPPPHMFTHTLNIWEASCWLSHLGLQGRSGRGRQRQRVAVQEHRAVLPQRRLPGKGRGQSRRSSAAVAVDRGQAQVTGWGLVEHISRCSRRATAGCGHITTACLVQAVTGTYSLLKAVSLSAAMSTAGAGWCTTLRCQCVSHVPRCNNAIWLQHQLVQNGGRK